DAEEEAIMQALRDGVDADDVIPIKPVKEFDLLTLMGGGTGLAPVAERTPPSLFASDHEFVTEAMASAFADPGALELRSDASDPTFVSLTPPNDLVRRLSALPQSYLSEQNVVDRLKVTADHHTANTQLDRARR